MIFDCENKLCVYWNVGQCGIASVKINELRMCDCCEIISIDEEYLNGKRMEVLQKYEDEEAER